MRNGHTHEQHISTLPNAINELLELHIRVDVMVNGALEAIQSLEVIFCQWCENPRSANTINMS